MTERHDKRVQEAQPFARPKGRKERMAYDRQFNEGLMAFIAGKSESDCPFDLPHISMRPQRHGWMSGFAWRRDNEIK